MSAEIGIIMGSQSDYPVLVKTLETIKDFGVEVEAHVVSAHRTPRKMLEYAESAAEKGLKVIIAGAGGAAHLPGMVAASTVLPVIGVPVKSSNSIDGWDSVLSILQMPSGVPVATVALNGAKNAGLLALQILACQRPNLQAKLIEYKLGLREKVQEMDENIQKEIK